MKISGKEIAQRLLEDLKSEISQNNLHPGLAIILAGDDPSSEVYVAKKVKASSEIGIKAEVHRFIEIEKANCISAIDKLNKNDNVHGIIVQYPVFKGWDFDEISQKVTAEKDVDGFTLNSPFFGATALGVWEMLKEFAAFEGLEVKEFLRNKKVVMVGKGRAAGGPTIRLLMAKGVEVEVVDTKTENPTEVIKNGDVIISASGKKHIVSEVKEGSYVIGVGVGREEVEGEKKTYGDIDEERVAKKAKLYCPTIGGIGPLTVASLLKNVVEASKKVSSR